MLDAAVAAAEGVGEAEWVAFTRLARAEARWLGGDDAGAAEDLRMIRPRITAMEYDEDARLSVWERRLLGAATPVSPRSRAVGDLAGGGPPGAAEPGTARLPLLRRAGAGRLPRG